MCDTENRVGTMKNIRWDIVNEYLQSNTWLEKKDELTDDELSACIFHYDNAKFFYWLDRYISSAFYHFPKEDGDMEECFFYMCEKITRRFRTYKEKIENLEGLFTVMMKRVYADWLKKKKYIQTHNKYVPEYIKGDPVWELMYTYIIKYMYSKEEAYGVYSTLHQATHGESNTGDMLDFDSFKNEYIYMWEKLDTKIKNKYRQRLMAANVRNPASGPQTYKTWKDAVAETIDNVADLHSDSNSPEEKYIQKDIAERVRRALKTMNDNEQHLANLLLQNRSLREIKPEKLGLSTNAEKQKFVREFKDKLKKTLKEVAGLEVESVIDTYHRRDK